MLLTIDYLKANHTKIHWFGLGFIQIKIDNRTRYHFYTTKYSSIVGDSEAHNHRYNFTSYVLKGSLVNIVYQFVPNSLGLYVKRQESCNPDLKVQEPTEVVGDLIELGYFNNDSYSLNHHTFHKAFVNSDTITRVVRGDYKKDLADVVSLKFDKPVCPFSKQVPEAELWEIVEEMLK